MVVALLALFVALGGSAGALMVVTSRNIKNGTIRGKDIHKRTITSRRIKRNGLGGAVIDEAGLSAVPNANHAAAADSATSAGRAGVAANLAAPEAYRRVGAAGQPLFQHGCANSTSTAETAVFFKDREGVVHLRGNIECTGSSTAFQLPAGYRPAGGEQLQFPEPSSNFLNIFGPNVVGSPSGAVLCAGPPGPTHCWLDGVTFRAAS